jgi:uncharacterized membrane protein YoaK (UPF0700 family)
VRVFTLEKTIFAPRHVLGWMLFTLSAGFVNAGAVMACKSFATHVTGNVTSLASDASLGGHYAFVVAMFIGGAMLAVLVAETLKTKAKLAFALPVLLSFMLLVAIAIAGKAGVFGAFGGDRGVGERAFTLLGFLAAAIGMVNASVANATSNQIRVSHLTGPVTDLAGNIVRAALGAGSGTGTELRWAMLRFAKLASFAVGAGIAAKLSGTLRYDVFIAAAGILIVALGFTGAPETQEAATGEDERSDEGQGDEGEDFREPVVRPIRNDGVRPALPRSDESDLREERDAAE